MIQLEMFQQKKEKCRYRFHYDFLKQILKHRYTHKMNVLLLFNLMLQKLFQRSPCVCSRQFQASWKEELLN